MRVDWTVSPQDHLFKRLYVSSNKTGSLPFRDREICNQDEVPIGLKNKRPTNS